MHDCDTHMAVARAWEVRHDAFTTPPLITKVKGKSKEPVSSTVETLKRLERRLAPHGGSRGKGHGGKQDAWEWDREFQQSKEYELRDRFKMAVFQKV